MVFAKLNYSQHYEDVHDSLMVLLEENFKRVEGGLQCDSYVWVWLDDTKVAVDTFTALSHEVKSSERGKHVDAVIAVLKKEFSVEVYSEPEIEPHE
ncbi:hypothetical protein [Roseibacillus persicicus]|uniref:hypothetical protein n=1 Tax=Roseibacillus persicicus TaxID=454148 RepID=UPI0028102499|nr:hypothetical protein [Roseibacillus persicicus]MDQ8192743.1 hypothetical protein [Roseibacillus persicicus]